MGEGRRDSLQPYTGIRDEYADTRLLPSENTSRQPCPASAAVFACIRVGVQGHRERACWGTDQFWVWHKVAQEASIDVTLLQTVFEHL